MSASVKRRYSDPACRLASTPWANAQTFPVHPSGRGLAVTTVSRSAQPVAEAAWRATPAVPSSLPSSTRNTRRAPRYSWPSSVGSVRGSTSASFRAGTTTATAGYFPTGGPSSSRTPGSSRWSVSQKAPRANASQHHAPRTALLTAVSTPSSTCMIGFVLRRQGGFETCLYGGCDQAVASAAAGDWIHGLAGCGRDARTPGLLDQARFSISSGSIGSAGSKRKTRE